MIFLNIRNNAGAGRRRKTAAISAAAAAVAAAIALSAAVYPKIRAYADTGEQNSYREYSVLRGNITVGVSESGTASVGRSYLSFPVSAEVEEVYIKVGSAVEKGDRLIKLNTDDVDEIKAQYESRIASAKLELDSALSEKTSELSEAKNIYETSLSSGDSADEVYGLSIAKIKSDISGAEKNIESLNKQLEEYRELQRTYSSDKELYDEYESEYEQYSDVYKQYEEIYSGYEKTMKTYQKELSDINGEYNEYLESVSDDSDTISELKAAVDKAKEACDEAAEKYEEAEENVEAESLSGSSDTSSQKNLEAAANALNKANQEYTEARNNYEGKYKSRDLTISRAIDAFEERAEAQQEKIDAQQDIMDEYSDMMKDHDDETEKRKTAFDEYKEEFNEKYGNMDGEDIADKLDTLEKELENAEYELENLKVNENASELSALQKKQDSLLAGENAKTVYDQTVEKINRNISDKQDEYDTLCSEYDEILENMGDGIYIYADCDGQTASVNVSEGDSVMEGQTVIALTDSSEIYVSVSVSEYDISSLSVGQKVSVVFSAYENASFDGEIDSIAVEPARSSGSVTYNVTVRLEAKDGIDIREGMSADVTFLQKQVTDVLYVNVNAVEFRDGASYVKVYDENGSIAEKQVVTGFSDGRYVEIADGVSEGDRILAEIELSGGRKD